MALPCDQRDRRVVGQVGEFAGFGERRPQIAQLIDQVMFERLSARPDATAADRIDSFGAHVTAVGDAPDELLVNRLDAARICARWVSLKGALSLKMPAFAPRVNSSVLTCSFSRRPPATAFAVITPIEPVIVPGCATIQRAGVAT